MTASLCLSGKESKALLHIQWNQERRVLGIARNILGVAGYLQVLLKTPNIAPVAFRGIAEERFALLQKDGKQIAAEIGRTAQVQVPEDLGFEEVDASVDGIGEDLPGAWLLQEALDAPALIGDDHPELQRVGNPGQHDGGD